MAVLPWFEWRKIERGEAEVVVGARSAIFAPIENIGVIIIDDVIPRTAWHYLKQQGNDGTPNAKSLNLSRGSGGFLLVYNLPRVLHQ
jgi:orotate phosphoribosyltransferase-like protein